MRRYKVTNEMLNEIEIYAEDRYSLDDLFDELNISKKLKNDEDILKAFEKGLVKCFIYLSSYSTSYEDIKLDIDISQHQYDNWKELYKDEILVAKQKIENDKKFATRQISKPLYSGMINLLTQNPNKDRELSQEVLFNDIKTLVKKIKEGSNEDLITILTTNILQLQVFNSTITNNLMGETGKQIANFEILSNMQIKVMQESRKSIMAINEIVNPKRTTFIKEASQHNHLHQNSEKKQENQNELENKTKLIESKKVDEVEVITLKEKVLNE